MTSYDDMLESEKFKAFREKPALKTIRECLGGISQERFARLVDVSLPTVYRWEKGRPVTLTISQARNLANVLKSIHLDFDNLPDNLSDPLILPPDHPLTRDGGDEG